MSTENEVIPAFNDEQKKYFQRQLAEQSGKPVVFLTPALLTAEQQAEQANSTGDFVTVKSDLRVRSAYLKKFGVDGFAELQRRHLATQRAREADEKRVKLEERKRKLGIR